jgi:hypothetical protein
MKTLIPCPIYYATGDAVSKWRINEVNIRSKVIIVAILDVAVNGWGGKAGGPQYGKWQVELDEYCCRMFGVHTHLEYTHTHT